MDGEESFPPAQPAEVTCGAFTYTAMHGVTVGGHSQASPKDLQLLFRKNASASRLAEATKPWIQAQMQWYGIEGWKSGTKALLMKRLEKAVKEGRCRAVPSNVTSIAHTLEQEYSYRIEEYMKAHERWELSRTNAQ